jgi:hypothetical protein
MRAPLSSPFFIKPNRDQLRGRADDHEKLNALRADHSFGLLTIRFMPYEVMLIFPIFSCTYQPLPISISAFSPFYFYTELGSALDMGHNLGYS